MNRDTSYSILLVQYGSELVNDEIVKKFAGDVYPIMYEIASADESTVSVAYWQSYTM